MKHYQLVAFELLPGVDENRQYEIAGLHWVVRTPKQTRELFHFSRFQWREVEGTSEQAQPANLLAKGINFFVYLSVVYLLVDKLVS